MFPTEQHRAHLIDLCPYKSALAFPVRLMKMYRWCAPVRMCAIFCDCRNFFARDTRVSQVMVGARLPQAWP